MSRTRPYSNLARHYRQLMAHVDYAAWGAFLHKVLRQQEATPRRLLEIGAGNGELAAHFLPASALDLRITTDLSFAMIADASVRTAGSRAVVDARKLPFRGPFDLVLMTYDAFNYLDVGGARDFFRGVRSLLAPRGLLIFDVTTERNSLRWFDDVSDVCDLPGGMLVRRSWYDSDDKVQYNRFDLFEKRRGETYRRTEELHAQNIYTPDEIVAMARSEKMRVRASYGNFTMQAPGPQADRIHFVLEKA